MEGHGTVDQSAASDAAREELLRRLALEDAARREQARKAKEESAKEADPRENIQAFLDAFRSSQQDTDTLLSELASSTCSSSTSDTNSSRFEQAAAAITALEQRLAEASYFLPAYQVRQASGTIAALKTQLDACRAPVAETKRFSFSRKAKVKPSGSTCTPAQPASQPELHAATANTSSSINRSSSISRRGCISAAPRVVVITRDSTGATVDEVVEDLSDCIIHLPHNVPALQLRRLRNCQLYSSAVTGATFIADVHDCIIMLASFQVRIHSTTSTDFYVHTKSKPIIEHSSTLRFAPYLPSPDREEDIQRVFGDAVNSWDQVDDFGWIKATASPNWEILPQQERAIARSSS